MPGCCSSREDIEKSILLRKKTIKLIHQPLINPLHSSSSSSSPSSAPFFFFSHHKPGRAVPLSLEDAYQFIMPFVSSFLFQSHLGQRLFSRFSTVRNCNAAPLHIQLRLSSLFSPAVEQRAKQLSDSFTQVMRRQECFSERVSRILCQKNAKLEPVLVGC